MADRSQGRGYLGELGRRLQRFLGFDGEPGATFDANAIPVMLVGDLSLPGYGEQQGRRWAAFQIVFAGDMYWLRAEADCIVESLSVARFTGGAAASDINFRIAPINTADPFALVKTSLLFLDRTASITDKPPLVANNGLTAVGGTQTIYQEDLLATATVVKALVTPFCLGAGQAVIVNNFPVGGAVVNIYGRTL